jgi:circadian clock protein KaiC
MEFLVRGAMEQGEPGVFIAFEETAEDLAQNVRSLGFDLDGLIRDNKLFVDYIHVDANEIEESGDYDLEGLFIRLGHAVDSIGAKRVVLDTIEVLFGGMSNQRVLRSELRRLFRWLKDKGLTAVVTGERGDGTLTRQGIEEYVSDCVIPPGPSRDRAGLDAAAPDREVPWDHARHERVSVPDRRERNHRPADHLCAPAAAGE